MLILKTKDLEVGCFVFISGLMTSEFYFLQAERKNSVFYFHFKMYQDRKSKVRNTETRMTLGCPESLARE